MILCSGCFDGIHAGHAAYLLAARRLSAEYGSDVAVAVAPDAYIVDQKGRRPRWTQAQRVSALRVTGLRILSQAEPSVAETIRRERPTLFVKGLDWAGVLPLDVQQACRDVGALVVFVDTEVGHTSDDAAR